MHPAIFVSVGPEAPYGADYDAIPPLKGPHAEYATYLPNSVPGATFVLTNKASAEAQVAAIKLVDSMFTQEGQSRAHYGVEGQGWQRPQEGDVAINKSIEPIFFQIPMAEGEEPRNADRAPRRSTSSPRASATGGCSRSIRKNTTTGRATNAACRTPPT